MDGATEADADAPRCKHIEPRVLVGLHVRLPKNSKYFSGRRTQRGGGVREQDSMPVTVCPCQNARNGVSQGSKNNN